MDSPHILIAEDDREIRTALEEVLTDEGFAVISFSNGALAWQYLSSAETLPSVILLDLFMPVMDGWQFRSRQRLSANLRDIPVIVLTASHDQHDIQSGLDAKDVLKKPIELGALLGHLNRLSPP